MNPLKGFRDSFNNITRDVSTDNETRELHRHLELTSIATLSTSSESEESDDDEISMHTSVKLEKSSYQPIQKEAISGRCFSLHACPRIPVVKTHTMQSKTVTVVDKKRTLDIDTEEGNTVKKIVTTARDQNVTPLVSVSELFNFPFGTTV